MNISIPAPYLQWHDLWFVLIGIQNTLLLALVTAILGTVLGAAIGWARWQSHGFRLLTTPYLDLTRSVPLLIQLILFNSVLSLLGYRFIPFWTGAFVLSSWTAVLISEVVRGSLQSVLPHYRRAARSLSMNYWQEMWHVTIPIATRAGFPAWIGILLGMIKDTSILSIIGVMEFLRTANVLIARTHDALLILSGVGLFYFLVCTGITWASARVERRFAI